MTVQSRNGDKPCDAHGEGTSCSKSSEAEPHHGMEFESKEEAFTFYKDHARSVGFSAIIKASRRSRISGKFIDAKFVCTRYGTKPENSVVENSQLTGNVNVKKKRGRINRSWSKTDCKACMHVKRRDDGRWIASSFVKEHNHDTVCSSNLVQVKKGNKKKMCVSSPHESNGFSSSGDAEVLLEYFSRMQDGNPYFFYAIDLNKEQILRNVFWIEAKQRIDYVDFGDVVLFDTMYNRNESKLRFVPFIGMNNHFEFVLLGCGFVADQSKSSYAWLLRAWLRAMHGRAPNVILTDQEPLLKEVVAEALPASRHCFCLWHVLSKIPEKLGYVMRRDEKFVDEFNKCVLKSQTEEEFEMRWWRLVDVFELRNDEWIESLHDDRFRWVPVYMKDTCLAGLSSPRRLESVVSVVDRCLLRKRGLREFLQQYTVMLHERYEEEAKADFESWNKQLGLKSPSPYGKQMARIYTHAVFKKFQVEVLGVVACHPKVEDKGGATSTFKVHDFEENQVYRVSWNEGTCDASCGCRLFEYNGYLCRHVMIVLQICGVNSIPARYILRRWMKNPKNGEAERRGESRNERYSDLYRLGCKLGNVASSSQEAYGVAFDMIEEAVRKCEGINSSVEAVSGASSPSNDDAMRECEELSQGYLNFRASALDCSTTDCATTTSYSE